eukprot:15054742-Alexandrium_andersonii.AAC.1
MPNLVAIILALRAGRQLSTLRTQLRATLKTSAWADHAAASARAPVECRQPSRAVAPCFSSCFDPDWCTSGRRPARQTAREEEESSSQ